MSEKFEKKLVKKLTEEQFDQFYNEGFVCVSNVFTEDEIDRLVKAKDKCFKAFLGSIIRSLSIGNLIGFKQKKLTSLR